MEGLAGDETCSCPGRPQACENYRTFLREFSHARAGNKGSVSIESAYTINEAGISGRKRNDDSENHFFPNRDMPPAGKRSGARNDTADILSASASVEKNLSELIAWFSNNLERDASYINRRLNRLEQRICRLEGERRK
jgi:hypothetical protein